MCQGVKGYVKQVAGFGCGLFRLMFSDMTFENISISTMFREMFCAPAVKISARWRKRYTVTRGASDADVQYVTKVK